MTLHVYPSEIAQSETWTELDYLFAVYLGYHCMHGPHLCVGVNRSGAGVGH
jgi:hypothetical protein